MALLEQPIAQKFKRHVGKVYKVGLFLKRLGKRPTSRYLLFSAKYSESFMNIGVSTAKKKMSFQERV